LGANRRAAISIRPGPPKIHPADKELLKPLSALGKANVGGGTYSFLRRTEYTASQTPQHFANATSKDLNRLRHDPKRRKPSESLNKDDPVNIIRNIVKGFDIAYPADAYRGDDSTVNIRGAAITDAEAQAWSRPKHPTKSDVHLVDSYPVLPDLEAIPASGFYLVFKFQTNPLAGSDYYDRRLDTAILRPIDDPAVQLKLEAKRAQWDPQSDKPEPMPEFEYDYYVPATTEATAIRGIKRKFDVNDPENDDPELYTDTITEEGERGFKYERVRTYETYNQHGSGANFYDDTVALALHDPEMEVGAVPGVKKRLSKAAYYYPIIQRTALKPKRRVGQSMIPMDREVVDGLNLTVGDLPEEERAQALEKRVELDASLRSEGAPAVEASA
jgi:RNA polymerase II-associated factor 1